MTGTWWTRAKSSSEHSSFQCWLTNTHWNGRCDVREFVLVSIGFLGDPFPDRLGTILGITIVIDPDPAIGGSHKKMEECRRQLWMDLFQQLERRSKSYAATGWFGRLDDEEQLVGLDSIGVRPFGGRATDCGGEYEPTANG